ncbi:ABC transporter ATP-binding protein [uncultured Clostridium sp.]|uniref:amino acid ABC transporter ATP-binding/permease protein n=1 Tax=uncultured Clostridium sp. TaxID=59620 RepID=UPI0026069BC1|nr:ABC transporter ATP-binding protein [uncultured Clostridium sp.]
MERQSGFKIMKRLIVELKPLAPIMGITVSLGVIGFLAAIGISVFAGVGLGILLGEISGIGFKTVIILMIICAILRGLLRYGEQLSGHYIAFKILYVMRDKVFKKLRELAPAKLEGAEKGNLISLITSDIELLEVFYAHTIAPIFIALITNSIVTVILYKINPWFGLVGLIFFLIIGVVIPYFSSALGEKSGVEYREMFSECNNYILDSLRGLNEIVLFENGKKRLDEINNKSNKINESLDGIKKHEGIIRATTDLTIMVGILSLLGVGIYEYNLGHINIISVVLGVIIIASSFGPVVALSNLSNTLLQTFACAQRLFTVLDETPKVVENMDGDNVKESSIEYEKVSFKYEKRKESILENAGIKIRKGEKVALIGESGIGKSTFAKLIMRFWDVDSGEIRLGKEDIKRIKTENLRNTQTLVSQETYLFNESILDNIRIGKLNAAKEEVISAAKKASIHHFIMKLPKGYDTKVGELGGNISSGEKQRIGLARAFLNNGDILILDEPTSNLDTLNESLILKSIKENSDDKTIILISHRKSTTAICEKEIRLKNKRIV